MSWDDPVLSSSSFNNKEWTPNSYVWEPPFFTLLLGDQDEYFYVKNSEVNLSIWKQEAYITGTYITEW